MTRAAAAAGRAPTMADVAFASGVSKMAVSRALSGGEVSAETRARILAAVERLGYVPDAAAGALSSGRSGFVAAIVPTINNSNFADTARGLSDVLTGAGLELLLGHTDYRDASEEHLIAAMLRRRPEGIVLTGGDHSDRSRAMLRRSRIPVIETWDQPRQPLGDVVGFSNTEAAGMIVRYLAARGYRRIGFIGGTTDRDPRGVKRRQGYLDAIAALGTGSPRVVMHGVPPITTTHGAAAIVRMLETWPDTDAVFCVSDLPAFGAIMECHRRGWAVPGRVAIAGFGDFEISRSCFPSITTLGVDGYAIGRLAAERLLAWRQTRLTKAGLTKPAGEAMPPLAVPMTVMGRESA